MKKVFMKYNPYKLETEIKVDGKHWAQNSKLGERTADGSRFQEWVEELPRILIDEYNDTDFEITFHGTLLDYEDLTAVFTDAHKRGELTAKLNRIPAKETADKEKLIDDVFKEIQKGPFDELRDAEILAAFKQAQSKDFEVCVVATMSAGKSTLINAMLGTKLMPSKQEACTAIITRIKDIMSQTDIPFRAEVYHKDDHLDETHERLTYSIMENLNSNEAVSEIKVYGNIPFVQSDDVSLVLIDTPGPNNSRDPRHKRVQSELLGKSSKALVLYIMTGEFGTDDDNSLLKRVAESMAVGGKQSKDRFIFVVNKLDDRKKEDGDTKQTLERVCSYLKTHGIANPNLFPAAALPALNLRLIERGVDIDEEEKDETEIKVKKLNRNELLHFETYATLPQSIRSKIKGDIESSKSTWTGRDNENPAEALIHSGIVSIEAAIRQYVQKYAKTAKVKNIVDTFMHKLDEVGCFEETKRELAKNLDESKKIVKQIEHVRKKIDSAKEGKQFKNSVDDAVVKINEDSKEVVESIILAFQERITDKIDALCDKKIDMDDVSDEVSKLEKFSKKLEPDFEVELNNLVKQNLIDVSETLLEGYRKKLAALADELDISELTGIAIDPLKLMNGSIDLSGFTVQNLVREERRVDKVETYTVKERTRGWFDSWKFWPADEYVEKTRTTYKKVKYINGSELAQNFLAPIQESIYANGNNARKYTMKQSKQIAEHFNSEFKRLDMILKEKLKELESFATDKEKAEERIHESEKKLEWLTQIKTKIELILEI